MFENMMKYKKAGGVFCKWLYKNHGYEYREEFCDFGLEINRLTLYIPHEIFILSIMPFFFDEYGIIIENAYNLNLSSYTIGFVFENEYIDDFNNLGYETRQEALIKACEKAFEILNNILNRS